MNHALKDFNQSGGLTTVIEEKWKELPSDIVALGIGNCAAVFDSKGNGKIRAMHVADKVLMHNAHFRRSIF